MKQMERTLHREKLITSHESATYKRAGNKWGACVYVCVYDLFAELKTNLAEEGRPAFKGKAKLEKWPAP